MVGPLATFGQRKSVFILQRVCSSRPIGIPFPLPSSWKGVESSVNCSHDLGALPEWSATADAWGSSIPDGDPGTLGQSSRKVLFGIIESPSPQFPANIWSFQPQHGQSRHYSTRNATKSAKHPGAKRTALDWTPANHLPLKDHHIASNEDARTIVKLWEETRQTKKTYAKKLQIVNFLRKRFPGKYRITMIGSSANGFGSDCSDVDLNVQPENDKDPPSMRSRQRILNFMKLRMRALENVEKPFIIGARCPILRFYYTETDGASHKQPALQVDVNVSGTVGILNTQLLYSYSRMDARVAPLVGAFRHWAYAMNIRDAARGFLSSYSLTLMAIFFLQRENVLPVLHDLVPEFETGRGFRRGKKIVLPEWSSSNTRDIGVLFRRILKFYSDFDFHRYCISVRYGKALGLDEAVRMDPNLAISPKRRSRQTWGLINIQEPFNFTNTASAVTEAKRSKDVKQALTHSNELLQRRGGVRELFGTPSET